MQEIKSNKPLKLGILFETDSAIMRPLYDQLVDDTALFMINNPKTTAFIEGHTDSVGAAKYNMKLSERRAESIKNLMVDRYDIESSRLTTIGYGPYWPI